MKRLFSIERARRISPVWWIAALFFLTGLMFLRKAGIHFDASYELASFYRCCTPAFRPTLFGRAVPVMILPYLGAFKAWLYYPLLQSFEVTPVVLRLPVLLVGTVSVWLFFVVLDRTAGRRAAIAGALLLATDASFVIATAIAPGEQFPAAREHLGSIAAQAGRTAEVIAVIKDRNQRPRFVIVRYRAGP
jgi:hypothetical protein